MSVETRPLSRRIISLLRKDPGISIKEMATELHLNRTFVAGYLQALEDLGRVRSKMIGPAKTYFPLDSDEDAQ